MLSCDFSLTSVMLSLPSKPDKRVFVAISKYICAFDEHFHSHILHVSRV